MKERKPDLLHDAEQTLSLAGKRISARKKTEICEADHMNAAHEAEIIRHIPDEESAVDIAAVFAHLADSTRVRLLSMLCLSDMCVCEMADILQMSQPAVSHHLRVLRQCGVIKFRRQGKRACYYLNPDESGDLIRKLLAVVCEGREEA